MPLWPRVSSLLSGRASDSKRRSVHATSAWPWGERVEAGAEEDALLHAATELLDCQVLDEAGGAHHSHLGLPMEADGPPFRPGAIL